MFVLYVTSAIRQLAGENSLLKSGNVSKENGFGCGENHNFDIYISRVRHEVWIVMRGWTDDSSWELAVLN